MPTNPPDIDVTTAQRRAGAATQEFAQFQSIRSVSGSTDATFSFGTRASRPASGTQGDRYYANDIGTLGGWLYYWTGTAWEILTGWASGTDATRAGISVSAVDNGAYFYTTDTCKVWEVSGGAWVDRFVSIDVTTSYEVNGTKVIGARSAAVADVASPDATDLATAITLVNELKAQTNTAFARLRSTTGHGLWT